MIDKQSQDGRQKTQREEKAPFDLRGHLSIKCMSITASRISQRAFEFLFLIQMSKMKCQFFLTYCLQVSTIGYCSGTTEGGELHVKDTIQKMNSCFIGG